MPSSRPMNLNRGMVPGEFGARDPVDEPLRLLKDGLYEDALKEASGLLNRDLPKLSKSSLHFIVGASNKALGNSDKSIFHLLEGYAILAEENQPAMIGAFHDEISRILYDEGKFNAALFFINMAIENFTMLGNPEMKDSCEKLRESILWNL